MEFDEQRNTLAKISSELNVQTTMEAKDPLELLGLITDAVNDLMNLKKLIKKEIRDAAA